MYNLIFMEIFALAMAFPAMLTYIEFFYFIRTGKRLLRWGAPLVEVFVLMLPPLLLLFSDAGDSQGNYTVIFPSYRPTVYTLILLCLVGYFYTMWRKKLAAPLLEILIHCSLLLGVALNILISLRMRNPETLFLLNLPAALLLILALVRNHRLLLYTLEDVDVLEPAPRGWFDRACCQLLKMTVFERTAVMVVLSLPVLASLTKMFLSAGRLH